MIKLLEKYPLIPLIFVIIIASSIFYISSLSSEEVSPYVGFNWQPITYHLLAFFLLSFFLFPLLANGRKEFIFLAIIILLAYALSDEIHQLFVPGRSCAFSDFLLDSAGIFSACFIYVVSLRRK